MAEQKSSSALAAPLHGAASVLRRVPGAGTVGRAAQGTLDKVGAVSPRGRRLAVYTGAGVLGVAGVLEWPVALTGAAVAWLTQPRPERPTDGGEQAHTGGEQAPTETQAQTPPRPSATSTTTATAARKPAKKRGTAARETAQDTGPGKQASTPGTDMDTGPDGPGKAKTSAAGRGKSSKGQAAATGPLGPTARPDRTSL
ncbi:hypothetical protein ACF09J_20375 [Streptomyces sp. NPDC014889]|uniref:hypothetical protein n=1 Tax=Streptomyces sp. NPDC014889 TaxID=3364928 RepID=UPI003702C458